MSRSRWIALVAVVVVVLGGGWWMKSRGKSSAPRYRTAEVERGSVLATVSATGSVLPVIQVEVGSQVSGTVAALRADYNSRVRAGQVLCQIDPSAFRARKLQSEAAVSRAQASLQDAVRQAKRSRELIKDNYISQADVDAAEAQVEMKRADVKQAQAQLESADVDLNNTTIRSPIDGVVIARSIDVGQTVAASLQAPKLFVIANDLRQMQVETRIDEADIGRIAPGLPVTFTVDAFPDRSFEGKVSQVRLEPVTQQNVVTYTTVIVTRNDDLSLRPGMTANVSVLVEERDSVLKVPNAALRFHPPMEKGKRPGGALAGGPAAGMPGKSAGRISAGPSGPDAGRTADAAMPGERRGRGAGGVAATDADAPGGAGRAMAARGAGGPAASGNAAFDAYRAQLREDVASGKLTREAARERMMAKMKELGISPESMGGTPGAGGSGGRTAWGGGSGHAPTDAAGRALASRAGEGGSVTLGAPVATPLKPGSVYVLRAGKPVPVRVLTGISDGSATAVLSDELQPGDAVIVGLELPAGAPSTGLQPPPGMGGPQFRGPGGGGRGGGRR